MYFSLQKAYLRGGEGKKGKGGERGQQNTINNI